MNTTLYEVTLVVNSIDGETDSTALIIDTTFGVKRLDANT